MHYYEFTEELDYIENNDNNHEVLSSWFLSNQQSEEDDSSTDQEPLFLDIPGADMSFISNCISSKKGNPRGQRLVWKKIVWTPTLTATGEISVQIDRVMVN